MVESETCTRTPKEDVLNVQGGGWRTFFRLCCCCTTVGIILVISVLLTMVLVRP